MWTIFLIFINVLCMVNEILSTSNFDCHIQEVRDSDWLAGYINDPVDDFHENAFKKFSVKNIEDVEIRRNNYAKYFGTKLKTDQLIIFPTEAFKRFEINEKSSMKPEMNVVLEFKCTTGNRYLSFNQPIRDSNTYTPIFEQTLYTYNLPMPLPAEFDISAFGNRIIACDLDISNVRLDFAITPPEDFYVSWDGPVNDTNKCHSVVIKTINPLRLTSGKDYQVTVTDTGIPSRSKVVDLKVDINEERSLPPNPYFDFAHSNAIYHASEANHSISVHTPIRLKRGCARLKLDILELEYKNNFRVRCDLNEVTVELVSNLPNDVLNNPVVFITIEATLDYAEGPGKTVLEIHIPKQDHPDTSTVDTCTVQCPPCPPTSNVSNCQDVTTAKPDYLTSTLHFIQGTYDFTVEHCHKGYVGTVTAIALPPEKIEYYLPSESSLFEYKDAGVIRKTNCAAPNSIYYFRICARGITSKSEACAHVILRETDSISDNLNVHVILVQHITEEREGSISLPCKHDCTCVIFEQYPDINEELFKCESKTIYASAIDREMEEIVNMKSSQFTLQLALKGSDSSYSLTRSSSSDSHSLSKRHARAEEPSTEWISIPARVFDEYNRLLLTIVIDDINDNPPTFDAGSKLVVGYPIKTLAVLIAPPYLAKVVATDPDVGENATIRYSTKNPNVLVDPETGVIYICKDGFDLEFNLNFTVTATDRNGADDGLSTDLEIEVKLLTTAHILLMKINDIMLEDVGDMMKILSKETNLVIKHLTATVVLDDSPKTSIMKLHDNASNYFTRIVIYGLNSENEPVNADELQDVMLERLGSFTYRWIFKIGFENIEESIYVDEYDRKRFSTTGCIIIPAVLLLLLVILIIAAAMYYHYKN